jgi:hypothetical protein
VLLNFSGKSQYERHFAKWGFRKNIAESDWIQIGRQIEERKRVGKDSDVYRNGVIIPRDKIRKSIARYKLPKLREQVGKGIISNFRAKTLAMLKFPQSRV